MTTIKNRYAELEAALVEREARMLRLRDEERLTMAQIAAVEGISEQRVSVILARIRRRKVRGVGVDGDAKAGEP